MVNEKFTWNHVDGFWYGPDIDPDEELDYLINFKALLGDDTILSHSTTSDNVTVSTSSADSSVVTVWLVSGVVGQIASVSVRIVTSGGRTYDRTFKVKVRDL